ncbi:MAG: PKD domain-containing protein [candidate division Zixibacteria bacterium]|nr:PKD domain-containing protein [candidate division Zixibacteria bacterium]
MKTCLRALLLVVVLTGMASANVITVQPKHDAPSFLGYVPDRFVVVMKEEIPESKARNGVDAASVGVASLDALADRFSVAAVERQFKGAEKKAGARELARHYKVTITEGTLDRAMAAYRNDPNVERVEPIGIHTMHAIPNDAFFDPHQWYHTQTSDHDIDSPEAWDIETGSDATVVAILDSGTRYYHQDLGGVNASSSNPGAARGNMWINTTELNGSTGVDDDGNGYVDDWIGYDFVESTTSCWNGEDCGTKDNDPRDFNGHGTHTAGIVGMLTNDGYGMAGVAGGWGNGSQQEYGNGVKVMPLRMGYSYSYLGQEYGVVLMDAAAEAFYYAADNGADIASCSWGSSNSGGISGAVDYFLASGGLVFVAAGNGGAEEAPDYLNGRGDCISVSATDEQDNGASFTTYGTWVDICAPGDNIYSTYHDHADPTVDYWASLGGTSMATPMTAGVAALIWSQNPTWSASQVETQLYNSTENIDAYLSSTYIGKMGVGRINAYNAVNTGPQPPVAQFSGSPTSGDYPLTVNFTDQSTGSPTSWDWTFGDGGTSTAQNPSHEYTAAGTYSVSLTVTNSVGSDVETKTDYITVTEPGTGTNAYAQSETAVSGTVSGSYLDTYASDNVRESIQERESGGRPSNRYTYLEHKWTFSIPSSASLMFYVEGYRNNNSDGDDFVFAYSTDDNNYTNLVTVNSATEQVYSAAIPNTVSGTVYIRVLDTDQTSGNRSEDFVYVDEMYIEYSSGTCTETAPVADFSGSPTTGDAPLTVSFTDLSANNPDTWDWDFGDGGTSTAQNPSHEYTVAGTYTVTLTASNCAGSDVVSKTDYITVSEPPCTETTPVADFSGSPTSGDAPLTVSFSDLSTNNPDTWSWDFGDGGTSTAQNPSYEYTTAGTYTVTLTASNCAGSDIASKTDYITVTEPQGATMHVHDIVVTRKNAGPNASGQCTITIYDSSEQPVSGATVEAFADGPVSETFSGVTATDGTVFFETGKTKNPVGEWCFEVTNVTHSSNTYNSGANHVTRSCESGDVYAAGPADLLTNTTAELNTLSSYPNPFNAGTNIRFSLAEGGHVDLTVYNVLGQAVRHLVSGNMPEGMHEVYFDARDDRGAALGSGMYFYRFESATSTTTRKMLLLK